MQMSGQGLFFIFLCWYYLKFVSIFNTKTHYKNMYVLFMYFLH